MASAPTARQGEYLAFISRFMALHGQAPSFDEIGRHFGVTPPSVNTMIKTLERRGLITRVPGEARSLRVTEAGWSQPPIPLARPMTPVAAPPRVRRMAQGQRPLPRSMAGWHAEILDAFEDAAEALPFVEPGGRGESGDLMFHFGPHVAMKFRGIPERQRGRVSEAALKRYVLGLSTASEPLSVPFLGFAFTYLAAHFELKLISEAQVNRTMDYLLEACIAVRVSAPVDRARQRPIRQILAMMEGLGLGAVDPRRKRQRKR